MKMPKPIQIKGNVNTTIRCIGYQDKDSRPYLSIQRGKDYLGWVEDRDIKRLLKWCQDCLKKR